MKATKSSVAITLILWHLLQSTSIVSSISRTSSDMTTTSENNNNNSEEAKNNDASSFKMSTAVPMLKESVAKQQRAISIHNMYSSQSVCETFSSSDSREQVLYSPGHPNNYPNNTDCVRILEAKPGFLLRLDFRDSFDIEPSDDCKFDYLEIRDGAHGFSNLLGQFCGHDFPPIITSRDRHLWLHFHSDDNIEYSGFTAVYEYIPRPTESIYDEEGCRMDIGGYEGFINRTDVPHNRIQAVVEYGLTLDCMWTITVKEGWKIQLAFENFKLDKPNDCDSNFIDIFDDRTDLPSRLKNFCGSVADSVNSKTNVLHIRFFAEAAAINSTFSILFTAYRDKPTGQSCDDDEYDCEDAKCILEELRCNERINCQFRWDEEDCKIVEQGQSEHIVIIIVVFGLILGGMMLTFLINCMRKIARDQKIIREHIRQSRESDIDALGRRELKKSLENLNRIKKKESIEVETYQRQESGEKMQQQDDEYQTKLHEYDDDTPYVQGNDVEINTRSYQVYPTIQPESRMCETASQTRESLFQNVHLIKAPPEPAQHHIVHTAEPRLSSFGHSKGATSRMSTAMQQGTIDRMTPHHHPPQQQHYQTRPGHQHHQVEKYSSTYSQHENERKSAPDVIIMTSVQR